MRHTGKKKPPKHPEANHTFKKIKQFLRDNAELIEEESTRQHLKYLGAGHVRKEFIEKYKDDHIRIIKEIAGVLGEKDLGRNTAYFNKLGEKLAQKSVKDRLTLEETTNGSIFLKQALWRKVEEAGLLDELTTRDLYLLSQHIGIFIDSISSKLAFAYHREYIKEIELKSQRFEFGQKAGRIGTYEWDLINGKSAWTKEFEALYGFANGGFGGGDIAKWLTYLHPDDRKTVMDATENALKNLDEFNIDYRVVWPDKTIHYLANRSQIIRDKNGKAVRMYGVNIDVTDQKIVEKKLQESEERFRTLIENSADAVALVDKNGKFTYVSSSVKRVLGYSSRELIGMRATDLFPTDQFDEMTKRFAKVATTPGLTETVEHLLVAKDGILRWIESTLTNLLETPPIYSFVSNFRDITDRKEAEERQKFLEEISRKLVTSFDKYITLQDIAKLIISYFADYCRIAIVDHNNQIREIAVSHTDPAKISLAEDLYDNYKDLAQNTHGIPHILKSGKGEIISKVNKHLKA